ncbi:MAG TPA: SRPBCC family protein [Intrasporangium sp.]|jgi:polyketide cyclase/dehydrase/lipid transport protein|uniref:SRPBCC family protein n=1 Tax=Intrasporangium sp. TaxID=1925024 RepID=UPI002F953533
MAHFEVQIDTRRSPGDAWDRVLDLRLHDLLIPFTRITSGKVPAAELGSGSAFVARTGLGPLGFDDPMVVEELVRPSGGSAGLARIRKHGKVIRGSIELRITPQPGGSRVKWNQEITVWGVPRALGWMTARVSRAAYGMALRRLLAHD